jgi:ATP-dependent RNA helicase SUPV3L1/SUV3
LVLEHAARDEEIRALANTHQAVERLWDVCQVPDYRKISPATHAELATTLYGFLMREGTISTDWFARQVEQADRAEGDIDTLSNRIAHIRTWTFAAKASRARSKTDCRTRCTSGSPSASSIAAPAC